MITGLAQSPELGRATNDQNLIRTECKSVLELNLRPHLQILKPILKTYLTQNHQIEPSTYNRKAMQ